MRVGWFVLSFVCAALAVVSYVKGQQKPALLPQPPTTTSTGSQVPPPSVRVFERFGISGGKQDYYYVKFSTPDWFSTGIEIPADHPDFKAWINSVNMLPPRP